MLKIMVARSMVLESGSRTTVCTENFFLEYVTKSDAHLRAARSRWLSALGEQGQAVM
jgi:hypothetical protein